MARKNLSTRIEGDLQKEIEQLPIERNNSYPRTDMHGCSFGFFWTALILNILLTPFFTFAGTIYHCVDKEGSLTISDYPLAGKTCKPSGSFKEMTDQERMSDEKEKKAKEINEKTEAVESDKKKAAEDLQECYKRARIRRSECGGFFTGMDASVMNAIATQCEDKHLQERDQCLQQYPQKP